MSAVLWAWAWALGSTLAPAATPLDEGLDSAFKDIEARCFECHSGSKTKGGLGLDVLSGWMENVDVESPVDSELLYRMMLPADDVDAMPPKGDRVEAETLTSLQAWMEAGAEESAIQALLDASTARTVHRRATMASIAKTLGATLERVRSAGGSDGSASEPVLYRVSWSHAQTVPTADQLASLIELSESVVELSLAGTRVSDELMTALPKMPALERAHLERTQLTDKGVAALVARAPKLAYLNVHSTGVSPKLHELVAPLEHLTELVVFGTAADVQARRSPFASLDQQQPRRLLAIDAREPRIVLLRATSLETHELLWERALQPEDSFTPRAWWLGDAPIEDQLLKGLGDGHGRVLLQESATRFLEIDTRSGEVVREHPSSPVPASGPVTKQDAQDIAGDEASRILWGFREQGRFPHGFAAVHRIERTERAASVPSRPKLLDTNYSIEVAFQGGVPLNSVAMGDVDPDSPGDEIVAVDERGAVHLIRRRIDDGGEHFEVETIATTGGELAQVAVGELSGSTPGAEIVAVGVETGRLSDEGKGAIRVFYRNPQGEWVRRDSLAPGPILGVAVDSRLDSRSFLTTAPESGTLLGHVHGLGSGEATVSVKKLSVPANVAAVAVTVSTDGYFVAQEDGLTTELVRASETLDPGMRLDMKGVSARMAFDPLVGLLCALQNGQLRIASGPFASTPKDAGPALTGVALVGIDPEETGAEACTVDAEGTLHVVRLSATWSDPSDFDLFGYETEFPMWTGKVHAIARDSDSLRDLASGDIDGLGTCLVTCGASGAVLVIHR